MRTSAYVCNTHTHTHKYTHTRKHTHTYGICITHTTLTEDKEGREHSSIVEQLSGFHGSETTGPGTVL